MITLKISMVTTQNSYSHTLIVYGMKLKDIYEDFNTRVIVAASSSPPVSRVKIAVTKIAVTSSINQMLI